MICHYNNNLNMLKFNKIINKSIYRSILKMMLKLNRLAKIFNLNEYLINLLN